MTDRELLNSVYYLRECFVLDEETGHLFWKERPARHFQCGKYSKERTAAVWNARYAGSKAGFVSKKGYAKVRMFDKNISVHAIVLALNGVVVNEEGSCIDHINGNRADNRLSNLRVVSIKENCQNKTKLNSSNKTGFNGVGWHKRDRRWVAYAASVTTDGRRKGIHIGNFAHLADAIAARRAFVEENYAGFVQHAELRGARHE